MGIGLIILAVLAFAAGRGGARGPALFWGAGLGLVILMVESAATLAVLGALGFALGEALADFGLSDPVRDVGGLILGDISPLLIVLIGVTAGTYMAVGIMTFWLGRRSQDMRGAANG